MTSKPPSNKRKSYLKPNKRSVLWKQFGIEWKDEEDKLVAVRGELALWRAVILQALEDAVSNSNRARDRHIKTDARYWLEGTHPDFVTVCDLAGYHPPEIRRLIKRALANQCKWRMDAGQGPKAVKKRQREQSAPPPPFETKSSSPSTLTMEYRYA